MAEQRAAPAAAAAVCLGAMLLYAGTVRNPPVWDDRTFVFGQRFLMDCSNLARVLDPRIFTGVLVERNSARPLWQASILLDTCAGGGGVSAAPVYRTTSIFLYALCALLVFALAWSLSGMLPASIAAGVLFAVHPVHAETVNIITFRTDMLCLAFMLAATLLYRHRRLLEAVVCVALALLSKEMGVVLPVLLALGDRASPGATRFGRRRVALAAACVLVAGYILFQIPRSGYGLKGRFDVFAAARATKLPFSNPLSPSSAPFFGVEERRESPPWAGLYGRPGDYARTMAGVFGSYLRLLVWPSRLQGDYEPSTPPSWASAAVWVSAALWAAILLAAWGLRGRVPLFSFGAAWTAIALLPVSGLVPILNLQAERYLFVPSAGWCLAMGGLLQALYERGGKVRVAALTALMLMTAAGAWRTLRRNHDFRSERAFHEATLAADPGVSRAQVALAAQCVYEKDVACARRAYSEGLRLWPGNLTARFAYMELLLALGEVEEARVELARAREIAPDEPTLLLRAAHFAWREGRLTEAEAVLRRALRQTPSFWPAWESLGVLLLERGRAADAAAALETALARSPGSAELILYHLQMAARRLGRGRQAARYHALLEARNPRLAALARAPRPELLIPYMQYDPRVPIGRRAAAPQAP